MPNRPVHLRRQAGAEPVAAFLLICLCFVCFFWRLGGSGLADFNEGLYVQAAREMVLRGDFVAGSVNGIPFFDKPPLALWLVAIAFKLFGFSEIAARLPVAIAASCTAGAVYWMGRQAMGRRGGLLAAAFVCLNPMFLGTARQMTMDIHQTWWVTAALAAFLASIRAKGCVHTAWALAFWVSCGLGYMAKSFPGLLPIPIVAVFLAASSGWRPAPTLRAIGRTKPVLGLIALGAVIAPWHWLAYRNFGDYFIERYWVHHHVGLLKATEFDHAQPFWFYIPMLLVGFFPWSFLLSLVRFGKGELDPQDERGRVRLLALIWAAFVFLAFSAMKSKLVSYLLPMYPACALLAAHAVCSRSFSLRPNCSVPLRLWPVAASFALAGALCVAALVAVIVYVMPMARTTTDPEAISLITPGIVAFAYASLGVIGAGLLVGALLALRHAVAGAAAVIVGMCLFAALCCLLGLPAYDRAVNLPLRRAVAEAARRVTDDLALVVHIGRPRRPSVFYYLPDRLFRRPLKIVAPPLAAATVAPAARRQAIAEPFMLEKWDQGPVRSYVAGRRETLVLADFNRGSQTLPDATVLFRSGRWALFLAEGARPVAAPALQSP